jgi:glycosyltransferase involved in cell wall biosynthesis
MESRIGTPMSTCADSTAALDAPARPAIAPMALVCLGELPWENFWKRNQSMIYHLSRLPLFERVVFVDPRTVWVRDELFAGAGPLWTRTVRLFRCIPRKYDDKIRVCCLTHFLPFKQRFPGGGLFEEWIFTTVLRFLRGRRPYVLLNNNPNFQPRSLLEQLMREAALRVFDLSDDFEEFYEDEARRTIYRDNIEFACTRSEVVLAVNEHVQQKYSVYNPSTYVIPNATNFWNFRRDHYRPIPFLDRIRAQGGPILGHTGTINRVRVDYELLESLVQRNPRWQFVFIGGADPSFLSIVDRHPNLHYHPSVAYNDLPNWIHYFDVGIIPFRVNQHTKGNDLLKFNDYLAMGKGIVTTNMGGAHRYDGLLWVASDAQEFAACIEQALEGTSEEMRDRRMDVARRNSWEARAGAVHSILAKHLEAGAADR